MKNKGILIIFLFSIILIPSINALDDFVIVNGTSFYLNEKPFYFAGTNNYYLFYRPWNQVEEVLNDTTALNLTVLRTWGFCSGPKKDGYGFQPEPGVYDETTFQRMDKIIKEAGDRGIKLMLPLVNNWRFKDGTCEGMCQYVKWCNITNWGLCDPEANAGTIGTIAHDTFFTNECTKNLYKNYINYFLNRTNTLTGIKYKDDPTIFAWQLANEPRARSDPSGQTLHDWIAEMSLYIKSIDPNHLLTTGEDGFYKNKSTPYGYAGYDGQDFISHHQIPTIDFASMHMYPWDGYYTYENMLKWIEDHAIDAKNILKKPVTLNEFGVKGSLRDEQMQGFYEKIEDFDLNGDIFWILCHDSYPDYDGYCIYYPGDSTTSVITNHANVMKNKNDTNNFPTIEPIGDIIINETQLITITVNATDPDGDSLTYFINDNRYTQNNNTFTWQTQEGDYGIYYTTIYVNDGSRVNISKNFHVIVKENKPCVEPTDGMIITENIIMCVDIYKLPQGIDSYANGITIDCRGSIIIGNNTGSGIYTNFDNSNITNCEIKNYDNGLYLSYGINNYIQNNKFVNNRRYAVYLNRGSNNTLKNNIISRTNNYVGLQLYLSDNNTIMYNDISYHDKGIYNAGHGNNFSYNNIYSNSAWNIFNSGAYNVSAEFNWWGTIDRSQISDKIYDYYDNPNLGIVDFEPYLLTPYEGKEYSIEQIDLIEGWNLISFPLNLKDKSINNIFASISFLSIFTYNNSWLYYFNETNNNFNIINETKGYWIKSSNNQTLPIEGTEFNSINITLNNGWNLVGHPSLQNQNVADTYSTHVFSYNGSWSTYTPSRSFNSLQTLKPGLGYWVYIN